MTWKSTLGSQKPLEARLLVPGIVTRGIGVVVGDRYLRSGPSASLQNCGRVMSLPDTECELPVSELYRPTAVGTLVSHFLASSSFLR